ncbi:MAG: hypothetical protein IJA47_05940 [Oscillospiraceae bacterium]|nr:hypothetical protein [Oscillospiraceae bacterium]
MNALLPQLKGYLSELDIKKEEAAAISAAVDAVSADTGLLEAAQELYRTLFVQEKLLDRESVIQWQDPCAEATIGSHMLFTVVMFVRAYELNATKRYVYDGKPLNFFAPLLRHFRGNVQTFDSVGLQDVKRFWCYCYLKPIFFELGRLAFEITEYPYQFHVYQDTNTGETFPVALAGLRFDEAGLPDSEGSFVTTLEKNGEAISGYTYTSDGRIDFNKKTFYNQSCVLNNEDMAIAVHIPGSDKLSADAVTKSLEGAERFLKTYFPALHYKAFICSTWLLDTGLQAFLKEDSNILQFQKRFRIVLSAKSNTPLFKNIFGVNKCPIEELVPRNRFQAELLQRIKDGGSLYSGRGYILK